MAEEDPEVAALRARLDAELSKPRAKSDVTDVVAGTAVKTVVSVIVMLLLGGWLFSSCFGVLRSGWH